MTSTWHLRTVTVMTIRVYTANMVGFYKVAMTRRMPYPYTSFSAKEPSDSRLFCGKWPATVCAASGGALAPELTRTTGVEPLPPRIVSYFSPHFWALFLRSDMCSFPWIFILCPISNRTSFYDVRSEIACLFLWCAISNRVSRSDVRSQIGDLFECPIWDESILWVLATHPLGRFPWPTRFEEWRRPIWYLIFRGHFA